jgi:5-methylcytosine-specific restriction endonuclease McrA
VVQQVVETPEERKRRLHREACARYRQRYPERCKAAQKRSVLKNPEPSRAAARRQYHRRPEYYAKKLKAWEAAHPEAAKTGRARRSKRWAEKHPERMKANRQTRRARLAGAAGKHTEADLKKQLNGQSQRCFYCRALLNNGYHVDHKTPLARGGGNGPDNLVCACAACNHSKGARTAEEFISKRKAA